MCDVVAAVFSTVGGSDGGIDASVVVVMLSVVLVLVMLELALLATTLVSVAKMQHTYRDPRSLAV